VRHVLVVAISYSCYQLLEEVSRFILREMPGLLHTVKELSTSSVLKHYTQMRGCEKHLYQVEAAKLMTMTRWRVNLNSAHEA
jgi:hypothetical protein